MGDGPTSRRPREMGAAWFDHGKWPRVEKHLGRLMYSGIVPFDEDWWEAQARATNLRSSRTDDTLPFTKPPAA